MWEMQKQPFDIQHVHNVSKKAVWYPMCEKHKTLNAIQYVKTKKVSKSVKQVSKKSELMPNLPLLGLFAGILSSF